MSEVKTPWKDYMGDVPMHLEYTQSHTSASGTLDVTERCECDVFVHLCVEWAHPSSPSPITHEYEWPPSA